MEHQEEFTVCFKPKNKKNSVAPTYTILEAAMEIGLSLRHVCGGNATCTTCRVIVEEGEIGLSPPSNKEITMLGPSKIERKFRLSCQTKVTGDITVRIPGILERQV